MGQKLVSSATYWRRRVTVLAAGVAVLGLPIWAVNEAVGGSHGPSRPYTGHEAGPRARSRAEPGHGQAHARPATDLGSRPQTRPSAGARGVSTSPSPRPGRQTCARSAVLLTLHSAARRYGPGEQVTFVVGAVSTRSRPCRIDLGPRFTSVVVAFGGTPMWDSSSCPRGAGSRAVMLRRGTPVGQPVPTVAAALVQRSQSGPSGARPAVIFRSFRWVSRNAPATCPRGRGGGSRPDLPLQDECQLADTTVLGRLGLAVPHLTGSARRGGP